MFPLLARGRGLTAKFDLRYPDTDEGVAGAGDTTRSLAESDSIVRAGRFTRLRENGTVHVQTSDPSEILGLGRPGAAIQLEQMRESDPCMPGTPILLGSALRRVSGVVDSMCLKRLATDQRPALVDVAIHEIQEDWFYPDVMVNEARRLSSRLVALFGAEQVYLFGSLAWPDHRIVKGDIDLAVEGIPLERFLDAVAWLGRATTFDVDLVQLETLPERLRTRIISEGQVLGAG
jgi:predicted nucleotidyltransferase